MGGHARVDVCILALSAVSVGFLASQDVISLVLWFELVNVPLVGLLLVRPIVHGVGGMKAWASAVWLLCG